MPTIKKGSLTPPSQELNPVLEYVQQPIADEIPTTTSFNENTTEDGVNSTNLPSNSPQKKSQFSGGSPQSQLLRKSQRVITKPKRLIEAIERRHCPGHPNYHHKAMMSQVSILTEPTTYKEALSCPDASKWQDAINEELNSLIKNKTWEHVSLPPNRKAIGSRWVFKLETNAKSSINRYKVRLVAKGYTQVEGIDYTETFSPVVKLPSICVILALAALYDLELHQFDVKAAFLDGFLVEEIYMHIPEGIPRPQHLNHNIVCKLLKALYGLKQGACMWY